MNEEPYKICLRLNADEAQKLIANAKACGLTRTAYLRRLLMISSPDRPQRWKRCALKSIRSATTSTRSPAKQMPDLPLGKKPHGRYECWTRSTVYSMRLRNDNGNYKDSVPERRLAAGD